MATSLGPGRWGPVPAVGLQPIEQAGVERTAVARGQVRLDVSDPAHPGDDRRDRRLGQDPAQGQLGHGHPLGHEGPQGLGPVDARREVLGDEVGVAPVALRPARLPGQGPRERPLVERVGALLRISLDHFELLRQIQERKSQQVTAELNLLKVTSTASFPVQCAK